MLGVKQQQLAQEFFDPFLFLHGLSDMVEVPARFGASVCTLWYFSQIAVENGHLYPFITFIDYLPISTSLNTVIFNSKVSNYQRDETFQDPQLCTLGLMFMLWHFTRCAFKDSNIFFSTKPSHTCAVGNAATIRW